MKNKELKWKIIKTILILLAVQGLAGIPTPGVNPNYFKELIDGNTALGFMNTFSGNGLGNLSVTALSITPYITASIILQLMSVVFPKLYEVQRDGEIGQRKFRVYTIILGVVLAMMQSIGMAIGFGRTPIGTNGETMLIDYKWYWVLCVSLIWTFFAFLLMVAGEYIDRKGFGNGISLILMCNILSSYPSDARVVYDKFLTGKTVGGFVINITAILFIVISLFAFTIYVQETEKRIPIQNSSKGVGVKAGSSMSHFPIKLCPGSVVPIIFASSLMYIPTMITLIAGKGQDNWFVKMLNSNNWFNSDHPSYTIGALLYVLMIFGFSYFYTNMILNPLEVANNFKKSGGMIPGVRPGQPTVRYLERQMKYTIAIGAIALSMIALVPCVISGMFGISRLAFAGSSIIITVGVLIETRDRFLAEVESRVHRRNYSLI